MKRKTREKQTSVEEREVLDAAPRMEEAGGGGGGEEGSNTPS